MKARASRRRLVAVKVAILYGRVSTAHQKDQVSLPAQFGRGEEWAERHEHTIGGSFSDPAVSGKRMENRPGLQAALAEVCRVRGTLVVWSFSRLARNVEELLAILRRLRLAGANFVNLTQQIDTNTATGRFMLITLANLDELIPNLTGEHVSDALAFKRERGLKYGEIPYGKRLVPDPNCPRDSDPEKACTCRLEDDPNERATLRLMSDLRAQRYSWPEIAAELNSRNIRTKKGKLWSDQSARKLTQAYAPAEQMRATA